MRFYDKRLHVAWDKKNAVPTEKGQVLLQSHVKGYEDWKRQRNVQLENPAH
jgi:hypothetical protein